MSALSSSQIRTLLHQLIPARVGFGVGSTGAMGDYWMHNHSHPDIEKAGYWLYAQILNDKLRLTADLVVPFMPSDTTLELLLDAGQHLCIPVGNMSWGLHRMTSGHPLLAMSFSKPEYIQTMLDDSKSDYGETPLYLASEYIFELELEQFMPLELLNPGEVILMATAHAIQQYVQHADNIIRLAHSILHLNAVKV